MKPVHQRIKEAEQDIFWSDFQPGQAQPGPKHPDGGGNLSMEVTDISNKNPLSANERLRKRSSKPKKVLGQDRNSLFVANNSL